MPPDATPDPEVELGPLLGTLRRRRPDVDIVVLPRQRGPVATPPPTPAGEVARAVADVRRSLRQLLEVVGSDQPSPPTSAGASEDPEHEAWHADATRGTEVFAVRRYITAAGTTPRRRLRTVLDALVALGWHAGPRAVARPTIQGRRDGEWVVAWVTEAGVGISITTPPLVVTDETRGLGVER